MEHADVVIIGGGAAGLMCAIVAGQRGRRVVVLEGSNKIGKKILMSGGGRCNFTNLYTEPSRFISANPHFCISALSRYTQWDFIALVEKHDIAYHEKTLGQLFCDTSSKEIVAMLSDECDAAGVNILTHCGDVSASGDGPYSISCSRGNFECSSLVIASGGLSIPKMGASDFGYRLARQYALQVFVTSPALVPFTLSSPLLDLCNRLSGVSCKATVSASGTSFTEDMLFTHRGLSGPVMLQVSSYWDPGNEIQVDLLPGVDASDLLLEAKRSRPKSSLRTVLSELLPKALVLELQELHWPTQKDLPLAEQSDEQLRKAAGRLQSWSIRPAATEGYRTAEVTMGGVDTDELSSKTMESKKHPGLYFIGEVVDVTGHLGGYNFQWAWSSGYAAGLAV